jgi:hypothetical protein
MNDWSRALEDLVAYRRELGLQPAMTADVIDRFLDLRNRHFDFPDAEKPTPDEQAEFGRSEDRLNLAEEPIHAHILDRAGLYWVAPEMLPLLWRAAASMPQAFTRGVTLPTPPETYGYVRFPHTVADGEIPDDVPSRGEYEDRTGLVWTILRDRPWVAQLIPGDRLTGPVPLAVGLHPAHAEPDTYESDWIALALWALFQQRVAVVREARPDRGATRRLIRLGIPLADLPRLRVVTLRRPTSTDVEAADEAMVAWSHRWLVDGHWRAQWYPSDTQHRLIWIAPHVKGPEHLPLVVKRRVYRFMR